MVRIMIRNLILIVLLLSRFFLYDSFAKTDVVDSNKVLINGWFKFPPYQYFTAGVTGFDIELIKEIGKISGKRVLHREADWNQLLYDLKTGKKDITSGATFSKERAKNFYFSIPYRYEEISMFFLRKNYKKFSFKNISELIKIIKKNNLKIAIFGGFLLESKILQNFLDTPNNPHVVKTSGDVENLYTLLRGDVDGFITDRITGSTIVWEEEVGRQVMEKKLNLKTDIHFIFSKKSVHPSVVDIFNKSINEIKRSGKYTQIINRYLYPTLLLQTVETNWFLITDIIGTVAFAISGLIIAYRDKSTLFGAIFFAALPALGGGIMRDVVLGRHPIAAVKNPLYVFLVISTVLIGYTLLKIYNLIPKKTSYNFFSVSNNNSILLITDAYGLASFTVTGVVVALTCKAEPLWIWGPVFACLTGAGGGILRDFFSKKHYIASLHGDIYPEIAIVWGFLLSVFLSYSAQDTSPDIIRYAVIITVIGAFLSRVSIAFWKIKNIMFR